MAITLDGTAGITTPGLTNTGTETIVSLTTTGNTILGDASTDTLTVGVTGIVKNASGNVGIGTASPVAALQVSKLTTVLSGTGNAFGVYVYPTSSGACFIDALTTTTGITDLSLRTYNNGTYNTFIGTVSGGTATTFQVGGTERMRIDSSGNLLFNSGYGSAATAYGCRAWVNFDGTGTPAIRGSGNVSSITDNGVGDYTVNFTTAMVDANYSISGMPRKSTDGNVTISYHSSTAPTTSACRITTNTASTGALQDGDICAFQIFR